MEAKTLTVDDLDTFVKQIKDKKDECDQVKAQLTTLNKELATLEAKAAAHLKDLARDNYRSPHGMISMVRKWAVQLPKTDKDKLALFEYFKEKGIFEKYATVNSNALNSLYLTEWEEAKKEGRGMEFTMPGIDAPKLHETVRYLKGKT